MIEAIAMYIYIALEISLVNYIYEMLYYTLSLFSYFLFIKLICGKEFFLLIYTTYILNLIIINSLLEVDKLIKRA